MIRNELQWIPQCNQKMSVSQVMGAFWPTQPRERLKSDLELQEDDLKKKFKGFMKHAMKLSHELEMKDFGRGRMKVKENQIGNFRSDTAYFENGDTKRFTGWNSGPKMGFFTLFASCMRQKKQKEPIRTIYWGDPGEKSEMEKDYSARKVAKGPSKSNLGQL